MRYCKKIIWLVVISTLIKLFIAHTLYLGNDEVYYWTYSQYLQINYFDHPPIVAYLIRLSTFNLLLQSEVFVRLGAIIASNIAIVFIFKIGQLISNQRTGWYAALLYTTSIYCSIIAGTFILPDSPQMAFWILAIFILFKIKKDTQSNSKSYLYWIFFGLAAGLCIMCKVHGVFLWIAVILYAVFVDRSWLLKKQMYLAMLVTAIIISPIIWWNIQHHFITYTYHSNRITVNQGFNFLSFFREILGSFFYNNPVNFVIVWMSVFVVKKYHSEHNDIKLVMFLGLPMVLVFLSISMFRETLPHWSGPGYATLIILAALYLDAKIPKSLQAIPNSIKAAFLVLIIVMIAGLSIINFYPGTFSHKTGKVLGNGDFTLDMYGWKQTGTVVNKIFDADVKSNLMKPRTAIIVGNWFPAAHIDYYIAQKSQNFTYAIGDINHIHQYYFTNSYKPALKENDNAYLIIPSNNYDEELLKSNIKSFRNISKPIIINIYRNKLICKKVFVYRLFGYKGLD